jgi:hypothetical protein
MPLTRRKEIIFISVSSKILQHFPVSMRENESKKQAVGFFAFLDKNQIQQTTYRRKTTI